MMGRPTDLTNELVEKASGYLGTCIGVLPTKEGLAIYLDVARSSLYEWCKGDTELHKDFSDIFDKIMAEQGQRLIQGGIYGRFNSTITKLMLSKHDYIEQHQTDLTSKGNEIGAISADQAEQLIRARASRSDS